MAKVRFEMEVEVMRLYTVPIMAEDLEGAIVQAKKINTTVQIEALGEPQDHEINLVGISRQVGRKMYQ